MTLITIKDIQREYGVGRHTAEAWAAASGAALERKPGQTYRVDKARLEAWLRRRRT